MSKGILQFDLPDEQEDFDLAVNAWKYSHVLYEIDQHLRSLVKYDAGGPVMADSADKIRDRLWQLLNEEGIAW